MCACVCVCVCMRACVCVCVCVIYFAPITNTKLMAPVMNITPIPTMVEIAKHQRKMGMKANLHVVGEDGRQLKYSGMSRVACVCVCLSIKDMIV